MSLEIQNQSQKKRKNKTKNKIIDTELSPNSYLKTFVFEKNIKTNKNKKKINDQDFIIPEFKDYEYILNYNYNVSQLKKICTHYKLKKSGNKNELIHRIYNFLYFSYYCVKIQSVFKGYLRRKMNKLHGPGFFNKKLCVNKTDFCTLEPFDEMPYSQFISITSSNDRIYGFDICSLYNYIVKYQKDNNTTELPLNPYDRSNFPENIIKTLTSFIYLSKAFQYKLNIKINTNFNFNTLKEKNKHDILVIFQKINELGNYTDGMWFLDLNKIQLIKFVKELYDIWNYRAQLSDEAKYNICPPNGNPFLNVSMNMFYALNVEQIINRIVPILNKLVNSSTDNEYKSLGAYYILSSLTLVSSAAADSLPWLYESVVHS